MALLVLGFVLILLTTFALIAIVTRPSPMTTSIDQRLASIRTSGELRSEAAPGTAGLLKSVRPTRFGWLDRTLQRYPFSQNLRMRIRQANSTTTVSTLMLSSLCLAITGYAIAHFFAPILVIDIFAAAALGFVPYGILSFRRSRRIGAFETVLPESIDMLARALRAGHSMPSAIEMLAENAPQPANREFEEIFQQQNMGLPLRDALLQLLDRIPSADLRVLVTAILVQKDTGGNLAEILDRTAFVIRERLRIQGEIRIQTAQGRLTGWILSLLPVMMMALINIINPGYSHILFYSPAGRRMIYIAFGLLVLGSVIIHRIVNGIEV